MVLGEVGEDAHRVVDAVDPVLKEGVGGGLHHHVGAAGVRHPAEEGLELQGFRRGPLRGHDLPADHILVGADEAHLGPPPLQNGLEKIGGGGLAVGAGDGHHGHLPGGMAVEVRSQDGQRPPGVFHLDIGNGLLGNALAEDDGGPGGFGLSDVGVAVRRIAGDGHEELPRLYLPGIVADAGDVSLQIGGGGKDLDARQQIFQLHGVSSFPGSSGPMAPARRVTQRYYNSTLPGAYRETCSKPGEKCSFVSP